MNCHGINNEIYIAHKQFYATASRENHMVSIKFEMQYIYFKFDSEYYGDLILRQWHDTNKQIR